MNKKLYTIWAAVLVILLAISAVILVIFANKPQNSRKEPPPFSMPSDFEGSPDSDSVSDSSNPESFTSATKDSVSQTAEITSASSDTTALSASDNAITKPVQKDESVEIIIIPEDFTAETADTAEKLSETTSETTDEAETEVTTAATTQPQNPTNETTDNNSEEQPIINTLLTSGDPMHYIWFEFGQDTIGFSGVYAGDTITEIKIMFSKISSLNLQSSGMRFTGTLDISSLDTGYHVIRAALQSGAGMYYVFEKTPTGARAVPAGDLPAESNLKAAENPLELPADGVKLHITLDESRSAEDVLTEVSTLSDSICKGLTSDYDKARALAYWVSRNIYYDKDASEKGVTDEQMTLAYILEYHRSVCFGWSNLYAALCQAQGIECYNASGTVVTGSRCFLQTEKSDERSHSWNMAVIDGKKIWVDTVWCSSNVYEKGYYNEGAVDFQYFDIDNTLLANDHRVTRFEHRIYY